MDYVPGCSTWRVGHHHKNFRNSSQGNDFANSFKHRPNGRSIRVTCLRGFAENCETCSFPFWLPSENQAEQVCATRLQELRDGVLLQVRVGLAQPNVVLHVGHPGQARVAGRGSRGPWRLEPNSLVQGHGAILFESKGRLRPRSG